VSASDDLARINELINQRALIQLDLAVIDRLEKDLALNTELSSLVSVLAGTYTDPVVSSIINNIQIWRMKKQKLKLEATDANYSVINLQELINNQRAMLITSIKNARESLQNKINNIDSRIGLLSHEFTELPAKEAELNRLQRVQDINQNFMHCCWRRKLNFQSVKPAWLRTTSF